MSYVISVLVSQFHFDLFFAWNHEKEPANSCIYVAENVQSLSAQQWPCAVQYVYKRQFSHL